MKKVKLFVSKIKHKLLQTQFCVLCLGKNISVQTCLSSPEHPKAILRNISPKKMEVNFDSKIVTKIHKVPRKDPSRNKNNPDPKIDKLTRKCVIQ